MARPHSIQCSVPFLSVRSIRSTSIAGGRLNADVPVTAVASANQASLRFGDARVVLEGILHLDCDKSVRTCRRGVAAFLCSPTTSGMFGTSATTADTNGRASVVRRVALTGSALFAPASLTPARKPHDGPGSVPCKCAGNPKLKRRPESVEFPGGRVPRRRKQDKALSGLSRGKAGSELVEVVDGAAMALAAAANPRVLMMPGGNMDPNALRSLRRPRSHRPWPGPGCCKSIVSGCNPIVLLSKHGVVRENCR